MSTHCNIVVKVQDDLYKTIYVHFDGYPSYMFDNLEDHYNSQELAESLVDMGDASSVGSDLASSEFYHRDRQEDWDSVSPKLSDEPAEHSEESYRYLWDGTRWKPF